MNLGQLTQLPNPDTLRQCGVIETTAPVLGITEDSRRVAPGWVFVARAGQSADGRRFIPDALRAGAVAVITDQPPPSVQAEAPILIAPDPALVGAIMAERLAGSPSQALTLVGVTGTNGKTTLATLIAQAARAAGIPCGLIGTVEIDDGAGTTPSVYTTPPSELLSPLLARMRETGCKAAAMEVSSHALDQHRTAGLRFAAGVFTNLTGDHLDYHGDMDHYAAAKARLFEQLESDALAVVNASDPWCDRVVLGCRACIVRCSPADERTGAGDCAAVVTHANTSAAGMDISCDGPWGCISTRTTLIGAHNAMNLLQVVAVCTIALGIAPLALEEIIPGLCAPTGRLEPVQSPDDDIMVLIDCAHTDDALTNCLRAARLATPEGARLWVVFGCGGEKDRTKRPRMGEAAAALADRVIVTSDNPRSESPESIIDEVLTGIERDAHGRVHRDADRGSAIHAAVRAAQPGDVVVIAGKGHEHEQELPDGMGGSRTILFDDHQVAREALAARSVGKSSSQAIHRVGRVQL